TAGDWARDAVWEEPALNGFLNGQTLPKQLNQRRDEVVRLLTPITGPLGHNQTRGQCLLPNAQRYGSFLREWGSIYERFGVPAEIGLAQAVLESGLDGRARSRARAIGFCQFLSRNWQFLNQLSPVVIEAYRSEEHTSELQSLTNLVCRLLLEKKNKENGQSTTQADNRLRSHAWTSVTQL